MDPAASLDLGKSESNIQVPKTTQAEEDKSNITSKEGESASEKVDKNSDANEVKKIEKASFSKPKPQLDKLSFDSVKFFPMTQPYDFQLSLGLGYVQSSTDYKKSLRYSYNSFKLPSLDIFAESRFKEYFANVEYKNMPAQVQSSEGHLNVFGWQYRHQWLDAGMGYMLDQKHKFSFRSVFHYSPVLFPTLVGVFKSEAAFEQVPLFGFGFGYQTRLKIYDFPLKVQAQVYNMRLSDTAYDLKYGFAWNFKMNPYYEWKNFRLGFIYNYTGQVLSLVEKNTGQDYPFKSFIRLHQFLLNAEVHFY